MSWWHQTSWLTCLWLHIWGWRFRIGHPSILRNFLVGLYLSWGMVLLFSKSHIISKYDLFWNSRRPPVDHSRRPHVPASCWMCIMRSFDFVLMFSLLCASVLLLINILVLHVSWLFLLSLLWYNLYTYCDSSWGLSRLCMFTLRRCL